MSLDEPSEGANTCETPSTRFRVWCGWGSLSAVPFYDAGSPCSPYHSPPVVSARCISFAMEPPKQKSAPRPPLYDGDGPRAPYRVQTGCPNGVSLVVSSTPSGVFLVVMGACGVAFPGDCCKPFFCACALLGGVWSLPRLAPKATQNAGTPDAVATEPTESVLTRFVRRQRSSLQSAR